MGLMEGAGRVSGLTYKCKGQERSSSSATPPILRDCEMGGDDGSLGGEVGSADIERHTQMEGTRLEISLR